MICDAWSSARSISGSSAGLGMYAQLSVRLPVGSVRSRLRTVDARKIQQWPLLQASRQERHGRVTW